MRYIVDVEANGLDPDKIWVISTKCLDTGEKRTFNRVWEAPKEFINFSKGVTQYIGHNFLGYDIKVLNKLLKLDIQPNQVIDTLVVSRLIHFAIPGGHGLEMWGERFGVPKPGIEQWDVYDPKMVHRCEQDVEINYLLYKKYERYITSPVWKLAMKIEHSTADFCRRLTDNGFPFDIEAAKKLFGIWTTEKEELEAAFQRDFPPRYKLIKEVHPVETKSGKLHSKDFRWLEGDPAEYGYSVGAPFSLIEPVPFDPASPHQRIDRLWEGGWKPINKTDGYKDLLRQPKKQRSPEREENYKRYGWKVDNINLATVPAGAPKSISGLVRWLTLTGKINQLRGWIELYNEETGCIHGKFHSIGAWSGRCSHSNPNMANASTDHDVRSLWTASKDTKLVGCDAAGIQLRVLAHYMDDPRFTFAVTQGNSKDGTDPHTLNAKALGDVCMRDRPGRPADKTWRDDAKTFIYAWLLGATAGKVAEIFECSVREADEAIQKFIEAYPGLKRLKTHQIPQDARRGYFEAFDGSFVRQDQERLILAGYLQNGETKIMRLARMFWENDLREKGIWYKPVNFVHDEWQTLVKPEDAEIVGQTQKAGIVRAGEYFKLRCPMDGDYKIGDDWSQTH